MKRDDDESENEQELVDHLNRLLAEDLNPLPPVSGDGGFVPQMPIMQEPIPEASPDNMICLRGPCKNYIEIVSRFNAGNTKGTLDHMPKQINRFCKVIPGTDIDLTDEVVKDCSEWDPLLPEDNLVKERDSRRQAYLAQNPITPEDEDE